MSESYARLLDITKKREKELGEITERYIETCMNGHTEKAALLKDIRRREDLGTIEKVFLAYKIGYIYGRLGGS